MEKLLNLTEEMEILSNSCPCFYAGKALSPRVYFRIVCNGRDCAGSNAWLFVLGVLRTSWMCGWVSVTHFGEFLITVVSHTSVTFSFWECHDMRVTLSMVSHWDWGIVFGLFSLFFPVCLSVWGVFIDTSSKSQVLFLVMSNLWEQLSKAFLISITLFLSVLKDLFKRQR